MISAFTLETISPHLYSLPKDRFNRLFSLVDEMESRGISGTPIVGSINNLNFYGGIDSSLVSNFINLCYDLNLVINFDECPNWQEGALFLRQGCPEIESKDLLYIVKLITYAIRQEKFVDGSLLSLMKTGAIVALIKRLSQLIRNPSLLPKYNWNGLKSSQLGKYAEYHAKMEFTQFGFDVYTSEVDDKGIDFLVKRHNSYYEVQVKSLLRSQYVYMEKTKFALKSNLLLALVLFVQGEAPNIYIVPSEVWLNPNTLFLSRDYSDLHKSKPEYGLQLSSKNRELLKAYSSQITLSAL